MQYCVGRDWMLADLNANLSSSDFFQQFFSPYFSRYFICIKSFNSCHTPSKVGRSYSYSHFIDEEAGA